jgi:hypothetical protein
MGKALSLTSARMLEVEALKNENEEKIGLLTVALDSVKRTKSESRGRAHLDKPSKKQALADAGISPDLAKAERAGMAQPRNIRQTIEANREELERNGPIYNRTVCVRLSRPNGGYEDREVTEYWLNESQANQLPGLP